MPRLSARPSAILAESSLFLSPSLSLSRFHFQLEKKREGVPYGSGVIFRHAEWRMTVPHARAGYLNSFLVNTRIITMRGRRQNNMEVKKRPPEKKGEKLKSRAQIEFTAERAVRPTPDPAVNFAFPTSLSSFTVAFTEPVFLSKSSTFRGLLFIFTICNLLKNLFSGVLFRTIYLDAIWQCGMQALSNLNLLLRFHQMALMVFYLFVCFFKPNYENLFKL